jgi:DNA polymerase V
MSKTFALVDCNNFYASCEKLFRPDLTDKPVVVLSNNDGCVIARSREAKTLGIKMGVPYFQVRELVDKHGVVVFSSNYALYADISSRVMSTLELLAPAVEVYSIDEAFLDLTGVQHAVSLTDFGLEVRQTIRNSTGMTVCVGIAPSKTLAKLANHAAKQWQKTGGVVDLTSKERQRKLMALMPVSEVWGIGGRMTKRLNELGIYTALQLADASPKMLRRQFSVVIERTVAELNGESCLALEDVTTNKKEIVSSRAFSERITEFSHMQQAVSEYVHRASEKLRAQKSRAKQLTVFIRTSPFSNHTQDPFYSNSATGVLVSPTDDTRDFLHLAGELLKKIWKDGYRYAKAGVMLADFYDEGIEQLSLFKDAGSCNVNESMPVYRSKPALMTVLDEINHSGKAKVFFAAKGLQQDWAMKRQLLSPAYTTRWKDIPKAN